MNTYEESTKTFFAKYETIYISVSIMSKV